MMCTLFKRAKALCLLATVFTFTLIGNSQPETAASNGSPVAFVYVTSVLRTGTLEIHGFTVSLNGSLTEMSGSPFPSKGAAMALNGRWLFTTDVVNIYAFAIQPDGALRVGPVVNAQSHNLAPTGGPVSLFLDHSGQSLYDGDILIDGANNGYQSFKIIQDTGELEFQQNVQPFNVDAGLPLSFIANNLFAYGSACVKGDASIFGYKRNNDGTLESLNLNPNMPPSPVAGSEFCPFLAAADNANHVAVSFIPVAPIFVTTGPPQLAVYTADESGTLTTTSNPSNMPASSVVDVNDMSMAPSGKLLAVAGTGGLEVFHFNGSLPVTPYTGLLTTVEIDQVFWDNENHLYAISTLTDRLYLFTITPTTVTPAPGSPNFIVNPLSIAVLPKP